MKRVFGLLVIICFLNSCEAVEECLKKSGPMTSRMVEVPAFEKIIVHKGISLVISQSDQHQVTVVSGDNLIDEIEVAVSNNTLVLRDRTGCNWTRDYGVTTVYVETPHLTDIISKTEQKISSGNTLTFPNIRLEALEGNDAGTGDFHLTVSNHLVWIETNNVAGFYLNGTTQMLTASFYEGNGPLRAEELLANEVSVFHRGTNHMYVHPVEKISGDIYSTGNVYCNPQPPVVNVARHYTGRLIFSN